MKSSSSTRSVGVAFALVAFAGVAYGQSQYVPSPCASVSDDKSRLQCYDAQEALSKSRHSPQAATAPSSAPASTPAPAPAPAPASTPAPAPALATSAPSPAPSVASVPAKPAGPVSSGSAQSEDDAFGLEGEVLRQKRAAENPNAPPRKEQQEGRVKSVTGRGKGDYRIELENGQVWAETQRTGGEPPAVGETVTIRRGMMGSYFLERQVGLALRVKRIE